MNKITTVLLSLATSAAFAPALLAEVTTPIADTAPPDSVSAADFIDLFEKLGGKQPGFRKAHAKGTCASGVFRPNRDNKYFKDAALFSQDALPLTVRYSVGSANPSADERLPGARGMGVQITLPNGTAHTITGNSAPVFTGKDPETFFGFLTRLLPDENGQVDLARLGAYIAANPSVQASVVWSRTTPAPVSYANTPYFGLHTFYFENPNTQEKTKYRWHLTPSLGHVGLTKEQITTMPAEFLDNALKAQIADENISVSYTLTATIGKATDSDIDPSEVWPQEREQVVMGTISITEAGSVDCDKMNFDPNILSAGFSPSADPVLRLRSPAYGISFGKRLSNQ